MYHFCKKLYPDYPSFETLGEIADYAESINPYDESLLFSIRRNGRKLQHQEIQSIVGTVCINKGLELFGKCTSKVREDDGWYKQYKFPTEKEYSEWKKYCIRLFKKHLKLDSEGAKRAFAWFDFSYGLGIENNSNTE